jgi:hypothetical protein
VVSGIIDALVHSISFGSRHAGPKSAPWSIPSTAARMRAGIRCEESRMTTPKSWRPEALQYVSQKRDTLWRLRSGKALEKEKPRPSLIDKARSFSRRESRGLRLWELPVRRLNRRRVFRFPF